MMIAIATHDTIGDANHGETDERELNRVGHGTSELDEQKSCEPRNGGG